MLIKDNPHTIAIGVYVAKSVVYTRNNKQLTVCDGAHYDDETALIGVGTILSSSDTDGTRAFALNRLAIVGAMRYSYAIACDSDADEPYYMCSKNVIFPDISEQNIEMGVTLDLPLIHRWLILVPTLDLRCLTGIPLYFGKYELCDDGYLDSVYLWGIDADTRTVFSKI